MWNKYYASQSKHISNMTLRCVVCGSPYGGVASDDNFYCWRHMPEGEGKVLA